MNYVKIKFDDTPKNRKCRLCDYSDKTDNLIIS